MSNEQFSYFERQPPSPDVIEGLFSILDTICERPPKDFDMNQSAQMHRSQNAVTDQTPGKKSAYYFIKGNENRPKQNLFIALADRDIHETLKKYDMPIAQLGIIRHEEIDGEVELAQRTYQIYADRVSMQKSALGRAEDLPENTLEEAKKRKKDEKYGISLLTEGEVIELNAELGTLIEDE